MTPPACSAGCSGLEPGVNPPFEMDNRSKRSVVLDLGTDHGREAANELLSGADVFVTNVRPVALQRLGLDFEAVAPRNPRLVYGLLTGYGMIGPEADRRRLRRRRLLGPRRAGGSADPTRRHPAVPARRDG